MKKVLLFIWQLPQNILGLLVILFTGAGKIKDGRYWVTGISFFGVSLGNYVIFGDMNDRYIPVEQTIMHEYGHQRQSKILGPLYLILIGIPSLLGNIVFRLFKIDSRHYYKLPWEAWADKLGDVAR